MNGKLKVAKLKVDPAWCDRFYDWSLFSYLGESMSTCDRRGCCPPSKSADTDFSSHELNRKPTQVMGQSCAAHSTPRHARWAYNLTRCWERRGTGGRLARQAGLTDARSVTAKFWTLPSGFPPLTVPCGRTNIPRLAGWAWLSCMIEIATLREMRGENRCVMKKNKSDLQRGLVDLARPEALEQRGGRPRLRLHWGVRENK